jgi:hypothetical protein
MTDHSVEFLSLDDTDFYILEKDNSLIFSFVGTNSSRDMDKNLKFLKDSYTAYNSAPTGDSCKVHYGFKEYYLKAQTKVVELVKNFVEKKGAEQKVYITFVGHSLGGSCILGAYDIANVYSGNGNVSVKYYSFGSPKIGNKKFTEIVESKLQVVTVINPDDLICDLPPNILCFSGFKNKIFVKREKKIGDTFKNFFNLAMRILKVRGRSIGFSDVVTEDHSIQNYLSLLSKVV